MSLPLVFHVDVQGEIDEAHVWYEQSALVWARISLRPCVRPLTAFRITRNSMACSIETCGRGRSGGSLMSSTIG